MPLMLMGQRRAPRSAFAKKLNDAPLAIVDKRRSAHNVSEVMNLIGDVRGKVAVLVDDMIDTAGTITNAAKVRAGHFVQIWLSPGKQGLRFDCNRGAHETVASFWL